MVRFDDTPTQMLAWPFAETPKEWLLNIPPPPIRFRQLLLQEEASCWIFRPFRRG